jgi:hypothetical protein
VLKVFFCLSQLRNCNTGKSKLMTRSLNGFITTRPWVDLIIIIIIIIIYPTDGNDNSYYLCLRMDDFIIIGSMAIAII